MITWEVKFSMQFSLHVQTTNISMISAMGCFGYRINSLDFLSVLYAKTSFSIILITIWLNSLLKRFQHFQPCMVSFHWHWLCHYTSSVIISAMTSKLTGFSMVRSTVCSGTDERKYQSFVSLAFVRGINRSLVDSPLKGQWCGKCLHLMASS